MKTKALISCAFTAQLICFFVFAYAKSRSSHDAAHLQGLKANVLQRFEENARQALQDQNQDSSDRHRSGSYSEAALRRYKVGFDDMRHLVRKPAFCMCDNKGADQHCGYRYIENPSTS